MRILVACEFSGRVRSAFRRMGHDAWSIDLVESDDNSEHHIVGDVLEFLNQDWDMLVAFPPCTYLSRAGARWLYPKGQINGARYLKLLEARRFFLELWNSDIEKIAIENPTPFKIAELPEPTQVIQPWMFGDPYTKRTLLWLKNLPELMPTNKVKPVAPWVQSNTSGFRRGQKHHAGVARSKKERSTTFQGVANAMGNQWSNPLRQMTYEEWMI
jgi:hypothetical protein